jgi:high-affinity K+ transport system ATPase subunit B
LAEKVASNGLKVAEGVMVSGNDVIVFDGEIEGIGAGDEVQAVARRRSNIILDFI